MTDNLLEQLQADLNTLTPCHGLSMTDLLYYPDTVRRLINWMLRKKNVALAEISDFTGSSESESGLLIERLIKIGIVETIEVGGNEFFRVRTRLGLQKSSPKNRLSQIVDEGS